MKPMTPPVSFGMRLTEIKPGMAIHMATQRALYPNQFDVHVVKQVAPGTISQNPVTRELEQPLDATVDVYEVNRQGQGVRTATNEQVTYRFTTPGKRPLQPHEIATLGSNWEDDKKKVLGVEVPLGTTRLVPVVVKGAPGDRIHIVV